MVQKGRYIVNTETADSPTPTNGASGSGGRRLLRGGTPISASLASEIAYSVRYDAAPQSAGVELHSSSAIGSQRRSPYLLKRDSQSSIQPEVCRFFPFWATRTWTIRLARQLLVSSSSTLSAIDEPSAVGRRPRHTRAKFEATPAIVRLDSTSAVCRSDAKRLSTSRSPTRLGSRRSLAPAVTRSSSWCMATTCERRAHGPRTPLNRRRSSSHTFELLRRSASVAADGGGWKVASGSDCQVRGRDETAASEAIRVDNSSRSSIVGNRICGRRTLAAKSSDMCSDDCRARDGHRAAAECQRRQ